MNVIRVLLIDDDENDSVLTRALLGEVQNTRYEVTWVDTFHGGLAALKSGQHDVCLLDNKLGPRTGFEVLAEARRLQQAPPFILLTGSDAPDLDAKALELGVSDYLVKSQITAPLLDRSVRYAIGRRRAEDKLRASDERFRSLTAAASDAIIVATSEGRIDSWNDAAESMFGYAASDAVGRTMDFIMPERYRAAHTNGMARFRDGAAARAVGRTVELHGLRKDGTEFPIEMALSAWRAGEGLFFGAIVRDITKRKAEADALQKAKEAAEHAMYARSAFLANMSHEIRTPMNGVIGMTSVLLESNLAPEQREYVDIIRRSGETLLVLINDILDFSKIESGKVELEQQAFDLADCIEESLALFRAQAHEKGIELLYLIHPGVPKTVIGDVTRLRQILTNLVSNAVKFTAAGEVEISVRAYSGDTKEPGSLIAFSVRDTGIGIPLGNRHRLFQYFSQIDASTTRQFGGTGLGLAISKRLCELMGGTMDVESTPGVGSTFHFTVNLGLPADSQATAINGLGSLAGRRFLVVDDNATNRLILRLYLEGWGAECVDVPGAEQALRRLATDSRFDVFLLDFQMPECDGLQLASRLRSQNVGAPIIVLTSGSREDIRERAERPAVNRVLEKPIKPGTLYQVIAEELGTVGDRKGSETNSPVFVRVASQHPLSILLAEDNSVNQLVAQRILGRLGYRVDTVANGAEVLQAFRQRSYEVVLMDVQMPEMDGVQATIELRARPEIKQPWIIAMTASAMSGDREKYLEAGMNDYVAKPVTLQDVAEALKRAWLGAKTDNPL